MLTTLLQFAGVALVGLSNGGWFGSTHQLYQHTMASVLRAVENRLPLVHVANNRPSIVALPSGRVIFTSELQKAGGYIVDVHYFETSKSSFYSKHPLLFQRITSCAFALFLLPALLSTYSKHRPSRSSAQV
ncbi:MAG: apolipoprotein N-acyltransferase [Arenicella sp.]|jgi:apolipoprotein N-acyltransferase